MKPVTALRLAWAVFALAVAMVVLAGLAVAQSQALCNNGTCVVPMDDLRAVFRYIEFLENRLEKTCI